MRQVGPISSHQPLDVLIQRFAPHDRTGQQQQQGLSQLWQW